MNRLQSVNCPTYSVSTMDGMHASNTVVDMSMLGSMEPFQMLPWMASGCTTNPSNSRPTSPGNNSANPRIPYPKDFVPSIHHVICGRGKKSYGHCGNKHFLTIVSRHIEEYAAASTKQDKSDIVQTIVEELESKGGFVRLDAKTGRFFKAEDGAGREKTSQALRDCLNHKYKSSKDIKRRNRKQKRLAKQAVQEHVALDKRPVVAPPAGTNSGSSGSKTKGQGQPRVTISEGRVNFPALPAGKRVSTSSSVVPPRTVSSTSVDMAAAAAIVAAPLPMPISPTPLLGQWTERGGDIHFVQELEPLPFRPEEVQRLAEMGPLDFFQI